jgi:hypothetical protein
MAVRQKPCRHIRRFYRSVAGRDYPNGVGTYIIKGDRLLRGVIANNKGQSVRFAAIPCECLEQAIALKQGAGETPAYD